LKLSPQQFWFAEAILTKRSAEATKFFSPCFIFITIHILLNRYLFLAPSLVCLGKATLVKEEFLEKPTKTHGFSCFYSKTLPRRECLQAPDKPPQKCTSPNQI